MVGDSGESGLLSGLDFEQQQAVTAPRGPVCVLAGAGTGKTRTITRRIAYLVHRGQIAAKQVLAVTFTAKAAGEMRTRLAALGAAGVQAQTFHAAAFRQLRYFWPRVHGTGVWPLASNKLSLVARAANRLSLGVEPDSIRDYASEIEWCKARLISPDSYGSGKPARTGGLASIPEHVGPLPAEQFRKLFTTYEQIKAESQQLDFDDLLLHMAAILESEPALAQEFRDQYRSFVVDEFQDVTPLQHRVLSAWLGERDDLTVVGDVQQTIYSFAGADPRWLVDFSRHFPDAAVVRLERDYRSTPQVVNLANRVVAAAPSPGSPARSGSDRPGGTALRLEGQLPDGPEPEFRDYDDDVAEARAVAHRIAALAQQGVPLREIAVLFRVNAQAQVYAEVLGEAEIPYQVRSTDRHGRADAPKPGEAPEAVTLASLHAAKGLEWDAVFLVGLVEGTLPIAHAEGDRAAIAEERRLLYVGVTRARNRLYLSWSHQRMRGSDDAGKPRPPKQLRRSRFLTQLLDAQLNGSRRS